jgi:outer membrane protein assembly factor BamE
MSYFLKLCFAVLVVFSALLTGCGASVPTIKPFKMDIQQGNVVTSKMLLQLKPGMTKSQVKFIMGTPLVVDSFHSNRWDYFYQMRQAGKIKEQRRVILEFDKDLLTRVRGDVVPEGTTGAEPGGESNKTNAPITVEPKPKEEGILDKLKFWKKDEKPTEVKPAEIKPALKEVAPEVKSETNLKASEKDALGGNNDAPAGDAPSMLAVPIGIAPAQDLPTLEVNKIETPAVEVSKVEVPKVEPTKLEPAKAAPIKPAVPALPVAAPTEPFSFRMDKNLDTANLGIPPKDAAQPEVESRAQPKKVEPAPLPDESEPGFFDRMLEKIGF